jgi:hypothetical protein
MARTMTGSQTLKSELAGLASLSRPQLQELWRRLYSTDPPEQISRQLLAQAVAHRMQVKALGGLSFAARRALERATEKGNSKCIKSSRGVLDTGVVLVRVWHGETHQVTTLEEGVQYRDQHYRSLSEVAREITGTRWSGPRFFGLKDASKRRASR